MLCYLCVFMYNVNRFITRKGILMKKISVISMLSVLVMPAFAEETKVADTVKQEVVAPVVEETAPVSENIDFKEPVFEAKKSNPKIKFPHGLQIGAGVSATSGLNGFIGYNNKNFDSFWAKRFGVRLDFGTYSPIKSKMNDKINDVVEDIKKGGVKVGDIKIENFTLDGHHFGALVDFYPFGDTWLLGGWRLSGGYFTGKLNLSADIKSINKTVYEFELDGQTYTYDTGDAKGKAKINWKYSGPYLGTGFDLGLFWGIKVYMDAGVVFTDKTAKADLNIPLDGLKIGGAAVKGDATLENELKNRIKAETKEVQKDLDDIKYYPMVKLGFMYRF